LFRDIDIILGGLGSSSGTNISTGFGISLLGLDHNLGVLLHRDVCISHREINIRSKPVDISVLSSVWQNTHLTGVSTFVDLNWIFLELQQSKPSRNCEVVSGEAQIGERGPSSTTGGLFTHRKHDVTMRHSNGLLVITRTW
jgi:hypothetical protein